MNWGQPLISADLDRPRRIGYSRSMSKNLLEAAERIAQELTSEERLQLAKELAGRTRKDRWNHLFAVIDERVKRFGAPSEADIIRLCREVRQRGTSRRRR